MKQIIFTFLFFINIFLGFAQLPNVVGRDSSLKDTGQFEVSNILFSKNMATGVVHIDVAANTEYTINIYNSHDHILLYNSNQQKIFSLFPGAYDIDISGKFLKNIPVSKGMDTRIKAGVLNITLTSPWGLYDENKIKIYSATAPKSIEFPRGTYVLAVSGLLQNIEIKDGETLEYNDASFKKAQVEKIKDSIARVEKIKDSIKIAQSANIINTDSIGRIQKQRDSIKMVKTKKSIIKDSINVSKIKKSNTVDSLKNNKISQGINLPLSNKWEIKPLVPRKGNNGRIFLNIPKEIECIITVSQAVTEKEVFYSGILTKERSFFLMPGIFNIKISGSKVKDVPVQKAMTTRIKAGILNVVANVIWTLYNEKKDDQIYYTTSAKKIGLPAGNYQIEINGTTRPITIKDGETLTIKD